MKAIGYVDELLNSKTIFAETVAQASMGERRTTDPMFVEVLVVATKQVLPWLADHGFGLVPFRMVGPRSIGFIHPQDNVMVTIQPAFGNNVDTGLPEGWPQRFAATVTAGFLDLGSSAVARRVAKPSSKLRKRRKNPERRYHGISTLSGWMRSLNGILLKEIGLGTWQIVKQPYEQWFLEGMRPSTAANIIIDGISMGAIRRRYRRSRS